VSRKNTIARPYTAPFGRDEAVDDPVAAPEA
jgi:hypothetical protein